MSKIEKLEQLLKNDVLVEVNNEIKSIEKLISKQKNNDELKVELDYMVDVKKYYDEVLIHIEKKLLSEEDAIKILEDLEDMRADEEDEI
jgi:hydrogenase maturation factor